MSDFYTRNHSQGSQRRLSSERAYLSRSGYLKLSQFICSAWMLGLELRNGPWTDIVRDNKEEGNEEDSFTAPDASLGSQELPSTLRVHRANYFTLMAR